MCRGDGVCAGICQLILCMLVYCIVCQDEGMYAVVSQEDGMYAGMFQEDGFHAGMCQEDGMYVSGGWYVC